MVTEKMLHNDIKKIKRKLAYAGYFQSRNPRSMHWWQKWRTRRICEQNEKLLFYLILDTVCLDPRYRRGDWNIAHLVPELINKGLNAPTQSG